MHQSIGKKKIIIYVIFLLMLSTTSGKFLEEPVKYSLNINKIEVTGLSSKKNSEIKNDLNSVFHQNIFVLGKDNINNVMNKHNIIEEYRIKKIYPSTLKIDIKPTKFIARITSGKQLVVGANGKLISIELNNKILPYIFGEFNSKKFLEFKKNIEFSKFDFKNFKTVYFFPSNRWDVLTGDNILIKLPQKDISESLNVAYKIITSAKFKDKKMIDLRIKNHLVIK